MITPPDPLYMPLAVLVMWFINIQLTKRNEMTKSYKPSSGTAGDAFMTEFCYQCKKDRFNGASGQSCQIITDTYIYDVEDDEYPKEWIQDEDGARCTAFESK